MEQTTDLQKIWLFLISQHVISINTHHADDAWSASLFYAADKVNTVLYVMTSEKTRHGRLMMENPIVSGTVADQTADIKQLKGIQFRAEIVLLSNDEDTAARELYVLNFPIARTHQDSIWKISFLELKLTDNTAGFGTKYNWRSANIK